MKRLSLYSRPLHPGEIVQYEVLDIYLGHSEYCQEKDKNRFLRLDFVIYQDLFNLLCKFFILILKTPKKAQISREKVSLLYLLKSYIEVYVMIYIH